MVVSKKDFQSVAVAEDGNLQKMAEKLGITRQSVGERMRGNPAVKEAVLNAREQALKDAGLSRKKIYKTIASHLEAKQFVVIDGKAKKTTAPDYTAQKEAYKTALNLHRDLKDEDNETPVSSIGTLIFNIMQSGKREVIDVV